MWVPGNVAVGVEDGQGFASVLHLAQVKCKAGIVVDLIV
jgi:hypothetical protein